MGGPMDPPTAADYANDTAWRAQGQQARDSERFDEWINSVAECPLCFGMTRNLDAHIAAHAPDGSVTQ